MQGQGLLCAIGKPGIVPGHLDDVGVVNDDDGDEYDIAGALVIATVKGVGLIRPIHDTNYLASYCLMWRCFSISYGFFSVNLTSAELAGGGLA